MMSDIADETDISPGNYRPAHSNSLPRRVHVENWCAAEQAIKKAVAAVEAMAADPRLTNAVVLLGEAFDAVADYVDEQQTPPEGWERLPSPLHEGIRRTDYPYDGRYTLIAAQRPGEQVNAGGAPFCLARWNGNFWSPMYAGGYYAGARFYCPVPGFGS